jgi:RNA polymerase-binding protein
LEETVTKSIHGHSGVVAHRLNAGRHGEPERSLANSAPRVAVTYWCGDLHETTCNFAEGVKAPATWPCPSCGQPAGLDKGNPPPPERFRLLKPGEDKAHYDRVLERRPSAEQREEILQWALDRLHARHALAA